MLTFTNNNRSPRSFNILQWYCCGVRNKLPQLQSICKNYDIICIQESLLYPSSKFSLRGFHIIREDIVNPGLRGVCILIRHNIVFSIVDLSGLEDGSVEMLGVEVSSDNGKFTIINIYRHPNRNTLAQFYDDLMSFGDSKGKCIFVGNFNAHHTHWDCSASDRAGKLILASAEDHYACILNDERPTLLLPPNSGPSVIDLVIATADMAPLCEACIEDIWGSDHYPITIIIGVSPILRQRYAYKINLETSELREFRDALVGSSDSFFSQLPADIKEAYTYLINHLLETAISCSSLKKIKAGTVPVSSERATPPWWSNKCQEVINMRKEAARLWQKELSSISNFHNFKKERARCTKTLYREKRKG
ncbi:hypothetical protein ALC60_06470 [Trachymyrmex zeteki]|uniref:Endonuclease/exonuclease/phosphatase domain-containing protein n=1 Tax=Mycetomoellerius zeteki TaxID=64791 RepID=A0A151X2P7_9HYME|nr:hypothetical protein ALC60_06470 [Trachymyrmex zeteki]